MTTATPDTYLDTNAYNRLIEVLAAIEHDPFGKGELIDQLKEALGEIGGLWPASIQPDVPTSE